MEPMRSADYLMGETDILLPLCGKNALTDTIDAVWKFLKSEEIYKVAR